MLTPADKTQLSDRGISEAQIADQLQSFKQGFPYLKIISPVTPDNGLLEISHDELSDHLNVWDEYLTGKQKILKFVPASGAASRMFKDLFEFLDNPAGIPEKSAEKKFFDEITNFAFYPVLNDACLRNTGSGITALINSDNFKAVVENLLLPQGLNYGQLPKGLLLFHSYADEKRTALQEHLVEGATYARNGENVVNIHFTVSTEHRQLFETHIAEVIGAYEARHATHFNISFSEQKPSTDTVAADENNDPFRENGRMVFRPGGHGALIENLNDLDADIIFIKNIDNVVPDALKNCTIVYKKMIAGLLVSLQQKTFAYLNKMAGGLLSDDQLAEIAAFCETQLNNLLPEGTALQGQALQNYLVGKLDRPMRICGMVKNTGEPGGGPFLTVNIDGTTSPQILESSQINLSDPAEKDKMLSSTHFNPVDLVCAVKNFKGEKFDLTSFVDKNTGFISLKSKNGKELKALELPGLWNGAMSDWNTIFVEVPLVTFNPVKTVNDLLRQEHQGYADGECKK